MSDARRFVLPIVCGSISEGVLLGILWSAGSAAAPIALLLILEAGILGFVFGPQPGAAGAVVPFAVFGVGVLATDSGTRGSDIAIIAFVLLLLGFTAWFVGSLRARYGRPVR